MTMQILSLEKVCSRVTSGGTPSRKQPDYYSADGVGHLWIKSKELLDSSISDSEEKISDLGLKKSSAKYVDEGSVLLAMYGANVGQLGWLKRPGTVNQAICSLTVDSAVANNRWLFYRLLNDRHRLIAMAQGAAQQNISQAKIKSFQIEVPSRDVQIRVASILSAYDDLIENNTRRIEILKEMARRLYEEWFVHFRFPGHEEVRFKESELGRIPEGWEVGTLQDVIVLQRGFDLPVKKRMPGDFPIVSATGASGTHVEAKVDGPGVVTGRSGSIGKVRYVHGSYWPLNTTLWGKAFPLGSSLFAFYTLSAIDLKEFNVGAAVPTLNRNDIHGLLVTIPTKEVVQLFDRMAGPIHELMAALEKKNVNLRAQRDLLLPKLISGEVDVSDIPMPDNKEVEAA
ncbi:restriction endonuclease subunit S [Wenzhouxiangella sp. EGI_FJ10409]|uniref:restriction endonuclease subunit S n=1 Tax=Wenzhouxiangella sp. EGI_FJ10409 TaxID=3243767 RepID=UPI0035D67B66